MKMKPVRRITFSCFLIATGALFWLLTSGIMQRSPHNAWLGVLVGTAMTTFFWTLGWGNAVRYNATHVSVTNGFITTRVPWRDVTEVSLENGLGIMLREGEELSSIQFSGSLLGGLSGYRGFRRAHRLLTATHTAATATAPRPRERDPVQLERLLWWKPPLLAALVFAASLTVAAVLS
ncbi:hypothetical protein ACQEU3_39280 [Spirillospora sp. CA-253888]